MKVHSVSLKSAVISVLIFTTVCLNGCAVHLGTIPAPPASAKVRVFVMPVTGNTEQGRIWAVPHDRFRANTFRGVNRFMTDIGVYEIVPDADVEAVIGQKDIPGWQWFNSDMALLKQVGRRLHADYAMIFERTFVSSNYVPRMVFVNIETGKRYEASGFMTKPLIADAKTAMDTSMGVVRDCYRRIFYDAKGDILATAVRKARSLSAADEKKPRLKEKEIASVPRRPPPRKTPPDRPKEAVKTPSPPPERSGETKRQAFARRLEEEPQTESAKDKARLVIHDFDTVERLNVVSLVLAEALREELFILGRFRLVNREDMARALDEMKLQQSGLVDEKQAVQLGKWLAANEAVTGRFAMLGNTYILQAKRTDIQTMSTLGLGSLKCAVGHEDELLSNMPDLARRLIEISAPGRGK
jgi:hypothetical protein